MQKKRGEVLSYGQLQLVTPYEIVRLDRIKLEKCVNDHGRLHVTGIFPKEKQDSYVLSSEADDDIALREVDENGNTIRILFQGLIENICCRVVRNIYYFEIEAISYTILMDLKLRTRTFQNKDITYEDLIRSIIRPEYEKSDFIMDIPTGNKKPGEIAVQFNFQMRGLTPPSLDGIRF